VSANDTKKQPYESGGKPLTVDEVLAILEENPRRIAALTADLSKGRLEKTPVLGVWSINDVLSHIRSVCDARGEFMRLMLAEPRPTLRANDPRAGQKKAAYGEFAPSFRAFRRQRSSLLRFLKAQPRRSWSRTAIITGGGPPRERTVLFYAQWLAGHERAHVRQLTRALRGTSKSRS
jgi:uncharacterized damage-inducible protein DinB